MIDAAFRFEPYPWRGGDEWMLVRGPMSGRHVLLIAPLFEEMNFTRALLAGVGRALAASGVTSWLPELPGAGDSLAALAGLGWEDWREAARSAGERIAARTGAAPLTCALRGGVLLDDAVDAAARWRYAPTDGATLLAQLRRAQRIADSEGAAVAAADGAIVALAGYPLAEEMRAGLAAAVPADLPHREPPRAAGTAPWRRAEPSPDPALCRYLAADILDWSTSYAGG